MAAVRIDIARLFQLFHIIDNVSDIDHDRV